MKGGIKIHTLSGFRLDVLPGDGGHYVILTTGCLVKKPKTPQERALYSVVMRADQARRLPAALLGMAASVEAQGAA